MSYIPSLQEEVNRKAYEAVSELVGVVESGGLSPAQADKMLSLLQTAFNGIVTDGDFCDILTDISRNLGTFIPLKHTLKVTLKNDSNQEMKLCIDGCFVRVGSSGKTFDTPREAYDSAQNIVKKLALAGYHPIKD